MKKDEEAFGLRGGLGDYAAGTIYVDEMQDGNPKPVTFLMEVPSVVCHTMEIIEEKCPMDMSKNSLSNTCDMPTVYPNREGSNASCSLGNRLLWKTPRIHG